MAMTSLIPWRKNNRSLAFGGRSSDPFTALRQEIDTMFNGALGDWTGTPFQRAGQATMFMPNIEVKDTGKEIRVIAELPGMEEKDIDVSLLDGSVQITGEKREEQVEEKGDIYHSERQYGRFERVIQLPAEVDTDKAKASFKNGVLKIALPKTKEAQSSRRVIPVES